MKSPVSPGKCLILIVLLLFSTVPGVFAQAEDNAREPVPYSDDEFPAWMRDLRRGEIIAFGVLPFSLFLASFSLDMYRFVSNGFDAQYSPWPFKQPGAPALSAGEKTGVILSGIGIAIGVAVADYLLGRSERKKAQLREETMRKQLLERFSEMQTQPAQSPSAGGE